MHFFWSPTASDFNLRQHRTSDSVGLQPPTASDLNLRQHRTSDSVGLQPPTASDLRQRRTITIYGRTSSPTASEFYLRLWWLVRATFCNPAIPTSTLFPPYFHSISTLDPHFYSISTLLPLYFHSISTLDFCFHSISKPFPSY